MRLHILQHVPFEGAGNIEEWAVSKGFMLTRVNLWEGEPFPHEDELDWLIVMGGPMNVYQERQYPWLVNEKLLVERAINKEKVVLGICLGAQLIANVLGSRVYSNPWKEIGWFPVRRTLESDASSLFRDFPREAQALHWHGDTFDIPSGCIWTAKSEACRNQAFTYGENVVGLQFHLESTPQSVELLIHHCREELGEGRYIQSEEELLNSPLNFQQAKAVLYPMLDALLQNYLAKQA